MNMHSSEHSKKMKPIQLIAMDMDGTLLNSRKEIDPKTKDQLIRIQEQGIKIALAAAVRLKDWSGLPKNCGWMNSEAI